MTDKDPLTIKLSPLLREGLLSSLLPVLFKKKLRMHKVQFITRRKCSYFFHDFFFFFFTKIFDFWKKGKHLIALHFKALVSSNAHFKVYNRQFTSSADFLCNLILHHHVWNNLLSNMPRSNETSVADYSSTQETEMIRPSISKCQGQNCQIWLIILSNGFALPIKEHSRIVNLLWSEQAEPCADSGDVFSNLRRYKQRLTTCNWV